MAADLSAAYLVRAAVGLDLHVEEKRHRLRELTLVAKTAPEECRNRRDAGCTCNNPHCPLAALDGKDGLSLAA